MKPRRNGKSILPSLLKQYGFDKAAPKKEETIIIYFDEADALCKHIESFPVPIIKSGEIFTYSTKEKADEKI